MLRLVAFMDIRFAVRFFFLSVTKIGDLFFEYTSAKLQNSFAFRRLCCLIVEKYYSKEIISATGTLKFANFIWQISCKLKTVKKLSRKLPLR